MTAVLRQGTMRSMTTEIAPAPIRGLVKSLAGVEWKASKEGAFRAVFSTFNILDHDNDVTLPNAFTVGAKTRIAQWGHNSGNYVIGRGIIGADDEKAWVDAEFNLKTTVGRDTYESVKFNGELQEWSYQYDILDHSFALFNGAEARILKRLDVHEVSPVLKGAGIDTRTEYVKSAGMKFDEHIDTGIATMTAIIERAESVLALRAKEGRVFSGPNHEKLMGARDTLIELVARFDALLASAAKTPDNEEKSRSLVAMLREQARLLGVPLN